MPHMRDFSSEGPDDELLWFLGMYMLLHLRGMAPLYFDLEQTHKGEEDVLLKKNLSSIDSTMEYVHSCADTA